MSKTESLIHSRRVWLAVAGVAIAFSEELGLSIPPETIEQIVMIIAAWIIGDSLRKTEEKIKGKPQGDSKSNQ